MSSDQPENIIAWFRGLEEEHWLPRSKDSQISICQHRERTPKIRELARRYGLEENHKKKLVFVLKCRGPVHEVINHKRARVDILTLWHTEGCLPKVGGALVKADEKVSIRESATIEVEGECLILEVFNQ